MENRYIYFELTNNLLINSNNLIVTSTLNEYYNLTPLIYLDAIESDVHINKYFKNFEKVSLRRVKINLRAFQISIKRYFIGFFNTKSSETANNFLQVEDIVRDTYMQVFSKVTFRKFDPRIVFVIYIIEMAKIKYSKLLSKYKISVIILQDSNGINSRILNFLAQEESIDVFIISGDTHKFIWKNPKLTESDLYVSKKVLGKLQEIDSSSINKTFKKLRLEHSAKFTINRDAKFAFEGELIDNRKNFCTELALQDLPNIFILSHVFNDFAARSMREDIFEDYYEWLMKTVRIIQNNKNINWLIKEHPMARQYKGNHAVFSKIKKKYTSENVKFLESNIGMSLNSIKYLADAVITATGSAGFEIPALYKIPSIYLSSAPYSNFKIGTRVGYVKEYTNLIINLSKNKIETLHNDSYAARLCYVYNYKMLKIEYKNQQGLDMSYYQKFAKDFEFRDRLINDYINGGKLTHGRKDVYFLKHFIKFSKEVDNSRLINYEL